MLKDIQSDLRMAMGTITISVAATSKAFCCFRLGSIISVTPVVAIDVFILGKGLNLYTKFCSHGISDRKQGT